MPNTDRAARNEYMRLWIAERRASFFAGKSCEKCGSIKQLELDHIDPAEKVSHRIWSWSAVRRAEEIAKCQVLCVDCHLEKTLAQRPKPPHGSESKYRAGCRCLDCREGHRIAMQVYRNSRRDKLAA